MKMIGHNHKFKQLHFWMEMWNLPPAICDGFAKWSKLYLFTGKSAENRATILHFKGNHIDAAIAVVVAEASSLHGMCCQLFHMSPIAGKVRTIFITEDLRKATRRLGITVGFIILLHFGDADVGVEHKYCKYDAGNMVEYWKGCTGRTLDS